MTTQGLLSIVQDREDTSVLIVRARQPGLLEQLLAEAGLNRVIPWYDEYADYPHRAKVTRDEATRMLDAQVQRITYGNFKNSVPESRLARLYSEVWGVMAGLGTGPRYGQARPSQADPPPPSEEP